MRCTCFILIQAALWINMMVIAIPGVASADRPDTPLRVKVANLVTQLGDGDAAKQEVAVASLLKLGTEILDLLPAADAKLNASQKKHLEDIRSTLRATEAYKVLTPRPVSIQGSIRLSKALAQIREQTGNTVVDRRQNQSEDPNLRLNLSRVPFWQAVDTIARDADLRSVFDPKDDKIVLVEGPYRAVPVSYDGLSRLELKELTLARDFATDGHFCAAHIELAWEPRFRPLFLENQPASLLIQDQKGIDLGILGNGSGRLPINNRGSINTVVRFQAPKRSSQKIGLIKGQLSLIGPDKMISFTFDRLASGSELKREGVTAKMHQFKMEPELWTVGITLTYPPDSPDFESFESWLVNNQIFLENKDGKRFAPGAYDIDDQAGHQAILTYRFVEENKLVLKNPGDWKVIYLTPGKMIHVPVKFEFKDVLLP